MFDSEHGRPFVMGMNGTFNGFFIPQVIPLDVLFVQPALPQLAVAPEAPSLPAVTTLRMLDADDFVFGPGAPRSVASSPVLPDFVQFARTFTPHSAESLNFDGLDMQFGWDAPALPVSDLHRWDMPAVSWFDAAAFDSLGWDLFLY
ncbi:MAG TPA: hypothetical protein VEA16_14985 [Vicinamibacterales bacterium]|nr:hypothetical protein [Vicinamibacterales bacterium]